MDFELFQKIIDEASHIGVKIIHLYLHGEPILHPRYIDLIRYIKAKNLGIEITTNGMLLDKEKIEGIINSGLKSSDLLKFSILGYSKEVHEKIMKRVNHEKVLKNVLDFLELKKKYKLKGPTVEAVFFVMPENEHEAKQFIDYWHKIVDNVWVLYPSKSFWDYKNGGNSRKIRKKNCHDLWNRMTVFWNGDVSMCCSDIDGEYILGNLKKQSIKEIWNSEKLLSIKKIHEEKQFQKIPLCAKCDF
jgi:radical SAM protein with 4Fe4S-binding SPASM domain